MRNHTASTAPPAETELISAWSLEYLALDDTTSRLTRARSALLGRVAIALVLWTASAAALFGMTFYGERSMPAAIAEPPSPSTAPPVPSTPDEQFLTALQQIGVKPESDAAALIGDGHQVCQKLARFEPFDRVVADIQAGAWINPSQANIETSRKFVVAATAIYCPQYQTLVVPPRILSPK